MPGAISFTLISNIFQMKIAVAGLGYVGLPLSLQFARSGVQVVGLDIDSEKVEALNQGRSYIKHIAPEGILEFTKAGTFSASTDFARVKDVEAVIICVPTPLNKNREPDISYVLNTGRAVAPHIAKGAAGRPGVHHLSRHHRRGLTRGVGGGFRNESWRGLSSGLFPGTGRPR